MARFNVFIFGLIMAVSLGLIDCAGLVSNFEGVITYNESSTSQTNDRVVLDGTTPYLDYQKTYTFGKRQSGDRLIAQGSNTYGYSRPHDIQVKLSSDGRLSDKITYVEIFCNQNSDIGTACISAGAIGQKSITVNVESRGVTYFSYRGNVYGNAAVKGTCAILIALCAILSYLL